MGYTNRVTVIIIRKGSIFIAQKLVVGVVTPDPVILDSVNRLPSGSYVESLRQSPNGFIASVNLFNPSYPLLVVSMLGILRE